MTIISDRQVPEFENKKFIKFYLGHKNIHSHIDAVHACRPKADVYTGTIVEGIVKKINCSGIIAIVPRTEVDLNRPRNDNNQEAIDEYRQTIREILRHINILDEDWRLSRPYLHLAVHGMKDRYAEIEIGTLDGKSCSPEVKKWFVEEVKNHFRKVLTDIKFTGDPSKAYHRCGDPADDSYNLGYGTNFNTFQIEISRTLRENHLQEVIDMFCDIIKHFNEEFI